MSPKSGNDVSSQMYSDYEENRSEKLFNGRYQLKKEIGKGQYGKVFLARDTDRGGVQKRKVAIKIV